MCEIAGAIWDFGIEAERILTDLMSLFYHRDRHGAGEVTEQAPSVPGRADAAFELQFIILEPLVVPIARTRQVDLER